MRVSLYGAAISVLATADALRLGPLDYWMLQAPALLPNMTQLDSDRQDCDADNDLYVRFPGRKEAIKVPQASIKVEHKKNMQATIVRRKPPETPGDVKTSHKRNDS